MENKKGIAGKVWLIIICIILVVFAIIGVAGYIHYSKPANVDYEEESGGDVSLTYTDDVNEFVITNAVKMSDADGMAQSAADKYFDFTVSTDISNANNIEYSIILVKDETLSTSVDENVKIYLEKQNSGSFVSLFEPKVFSANIKTGKYDGEAMTIYKTSRKQSGKDNYRLRMWISDTAVLTEGQIENFGVKIIVDGKAS